ncbi:MAG TPA: hypothetical protein VE991_04025 [Acidimicrobiales bacterium]|nr:hypothetical protein [Acidimicrobiales bacterium]
MFLHVDLDTDPPAVVLEEPDDVGRFHVAVRGGDTGRLDTALRAMGVGALEGDHAVVDPDGLRRLAAGRVGPDWAGRFDGMVAYARAKGFVGADGQAIRAHLEWE